MAGALELINRSLKAFNRRAYTHSWLRCLDLAMFCSSIIQEVQPCPCGCSSWCDDDDDGDDGALLRYMLYDLFVLYPMALVDMPGLQNKLQMLLSISRLLYEVTNGQTLDSSRPTACRPYATAPINCCIEGWKCRLAVGPEQKVYL
ncbi:hypothetical protein EVAR_73437_1 [Eumeta japonica]|uniref:Uncharacterized protein n=1 Tax=Eumeta variegata TaxID=151549 RepID=A0A4C2ABN6_EUMVA|nr:hypothetical protein EVAR_73437_1 [Eumeta japonica]